MKELEEYLLRHENDIALEINDFGDLAGVFLFIFGCLATYNTTDE